jgi:hypothetical protein
MSGVSMVHDFITLTIALLWPATILIIVYGFRKGIKDLIASITEVKIGNNIAAKFGQAKIDTQLLPGPPASKEISAPSPMKWDKPANLFWLGNDVEWTAQTVLRGAPKERILHGLAQCHHHISQIGMAESAPAKQLVLLKSDVEILTESMLDRQWRNDFAEKIYLVIRQVSDLLKGHQQDFSPGP